MTEDDTKQPASDKGGSSALDREKSEAELADRERPERVEQDNRVQAIAREAREESTGATESPEQLNKDG